MKQIKHLVLLLTGLCLAALASAQSLKGTYQYLGGTYNGKPDTAPTDYQLQRTYRDSTFEAFALQKGYKPERYEAGHYTLKADTAYETSTYSSQPLDILNKTIAYHYTLKNNVLTLSGTLPKGTVVEERWRRVATPKPLKGGL